MDMYNKIQNMTTTELVAFREEIKIASVANDTWFDSEMNKLTKINAVLKEVGNAMMTALDADDFEKLDELVLVEKSLLGLI